MGRITTLSTQRLSATIILLWWDFLCELCNGDASTQITTRLLFFFFFLLLFFVILSPLFATGASDHSAAPQLLVRRRKGTHTQRGPEEASSWRPSDRQVLPRRFKEHEHEVQEVHHHHAGSSRSGSPQQERADPTTTQTLEACTVSS